MAPWPLLCVSWATHIYKAHERAGTTLPVPRFRQILTNRAWTGITVKQQFPEVLSWAVTVHKVFLCVCLMNF